VEAERAIDGTTASFTGTLNLNNATISGNSTADIVTLNGGTLVAAAARSAARSARWCCNTVAAYERRRNDQRHLERRRERHLAYQRHRRPVHHQRRIAHKQHWLGVPGQCRHALGYLRRHDYAKTPRVSARSTFRIRPAAQSRFRERISRATAGNGIFLNSNTKLDDRSRKRDCAAGRILNVDRALTRGVLRNRAAVGNRAVAGIDQERRASVVWSDPPLMVYGPPVTLISEMPFAPPLE